MVSAVAGWYDDGSGLQRWWDGEQWTDRFQDAGSSLSGATSKMAHLASQFASKAKANLSRTDDPADLAGTLWSAVGEPLARIGAGRYRLTEDYLFFEKGSLSSRGEQIRIAEVFDADVSQSMQQKMRGVGTIKLLARRPMGDEIVLLEDIPNFRDGVAIINDTADRARRRLIDLEIHKNTQRVEQSVNYNGTPPMGAMFGGPATAAAPSAGIDLNAELAKLVTLKEQGILDDEEFAAAKRKLLGL